MNYKEFASTARDLLYSGEATHLRLMDLLVKVHDTPRIWKKEHGTWAELLRVERLCTLARFKAFERVVAQDLPVEKLGVDAACRIATYPKQVQETALAMTLGWIDEHKVPPTYQLVAEFVKGLGPPRTPSTVARLRARVALLEKLCDKHGIKYPKEKGR